LFGVSAPLVVASAAVTIVEVRVHVGDGRDADARRLDDFDGLDADAVPDVALRRHVVPYNVGHDDGGEDAAVSTAPFPSVQPYLKSA